MPSRPAELHNVPNDQEITRKFQLPNQRQFVASLLLALSRKARSRASADTVPVRLPQHAFPETLAWCRHRARDSLGSGIPDRSSCKSGVRKAPLCWRLPPEDRGTTLASHGENADDVRHSVRASGLRCRACEWWRMLVSTSMTSRS